MKEEVEAHWEEEEEAHLVVVFLRYCLSILVFVCVYMALLHECGPSFA